MCINNYLTLRLKKQIGISLIELILFIIIISISLTGLLLVLNINTKNSVDPLIRKQALAITESLLEEIELQDFSNPVGGFTGAAIQANRNLFDDISDYNGFATTGIYPANSSATVITGLSNYNVSVSILTPLTANWNNIPAAKVAKITVTVTMPNSQTLKTIGYRVNF